MVIEKQDRGYCSARALGTEYAGGRQYTNFFADRAPLYPARGMEGDSRNLGMRRMRGGSVSATNLDVLQNHQRPVHTRNRTVIWGARVCVRGGVVGLARLG